MNEGKPFVWKGKPLLTVGDLFNAMVAVADDAEAAQFMAAYRAVSRHADDNIGYLTGYCTPDTAARLRERFDVSHPIFGRTSPTSDAL